MTSGMQRGSMSMEPKTACSAGAEYGARLPSSSSIPGASRRSYFFSVTRTFMVPETS